MKLSPQAKRGRPRKDSATVNAPQSNMRNDYWGNLISRLGASNSRVNSTCYNPSFRLDRQQLTDIYLSDGIGRRVVNILIDDAMRAFIHAEGELIDELARIKSKQKIIDSATWARLYGGSVLVAFVDDGQDIDRPINYKTIKKVVSLKSYDRWQITWDISDLSINYYDEHFGEPDIYTINPINGIPFRVHKSRLHVFNGERVPNRERVANNYWDQSVLQAVYESLRNYGSTMNASAEIVQDFVQTILGINGLTEMLRQGEDDLITARANVIDLTRSVANTIFLDSEHETYEKKASSVAGLPELWDRFSEAISATTGIPLTKLLGRSPAGLNSTGKNDADNWDNIVEAYRTDEIEPCIKWIIKMLEAQTMWEASNRPQSYEWQFPSLKVANEHELAQNRLLAAQTDQIYMDRGAVDPAFIFKKRYANGGYDTDIFIEESEFNNIVTEDVIVVDPANSDLMIDVKTDSNTREDDIKLEIMSDDIASILNRLDGLDSIANVDKVENSLSITTKLGKSFNIDLDDKPALDIDAFKTELLKENNNTIEAKIIAHDSVVKKQLRDLEKNLLRSINSLVTTNKDQLTEIENILFEVSDGI